MAVSAKEVKALRDLTGAGMMDCKEALSEAEGDVERAQEILREKGLSKAGKRAGRETSEGTVAIASDGGAAAIVELGCETDFVAKTDDFQALADAIARRVLDDASLDSVDALLAASLDGGTVDERIKATVAKVGENIQLKRIGRVETQGVAGGYVHGGGKLAVVVALQTTAKGDAIHGLARDLSMHVAASDPTPIAVDREGVDPAVVTKERDFLAKQAEESGKPPEVVEKMVSGRINKFFKEICLLEQPFVKDPDQSVTKIVEAVAKEAGDEIAVAAFARFALGETAT